MKKIIMISTIITTLSIINTNSCMFTKYLKNKKLSIHYKRYSSSELIKHLKSQKALLTNIVKASHKQAKLTDTCHENISKILSQSDHLPSDNEHIKTQNRILIHAIDELSRQRKQTQTLQENISDMLTQNDLIKNHLLLKTADEIKHTYLQIKSDKYHMSGYYNETAENTQYPSTPSENRK